MGDTGYFTHYGFFGDRNEGKDKYSNFSIDAADRDMMLMLI